VFPDMNTTAELLAREIYTYAHEVLEEQGFKNVPLVRVGVSETPKTWAYYYQDRSMSGAYGIPQRLANTFEGSTTQQL